MAGSYIPGEEYSGWRLRETGAARCLRGTGEEGGKGVHGKVSSGFFLQRKVFHQLTTILSRSNRGNLVN